MTIITFSILFLLALLATIWIADFVSVVFGSADEDAIDDYGCPEAVIAWGLAGLAFWIVCAAVWVALA